jgi:hypothetical protein
MPPLATAEHARTGHRNCKQDMEDIHFHKTCGDSGIHTSTPSQSTCMSAMKWMAETPLRFSQSPKIFTEGPVADGKVASTPFPALVLACAAARIPLALMDGSAAKSLPRLAASRAGVATTRKEETKTAKRVALSHMRTQGEGGQHFFHRF